MSIKKAVIAVAGYGTRFLPATKSVPKEMLPIVNKPIVQYLVEEAVQSGIEDIILVTRSGSNAIADHFDSSRELEQHLSSQHNDPYLQIIKQIPRLATFAVMRQRADLPYGNGSPLLVAKRFLNLSEPFVFMFGDDLVLSARPCVQQLIDIYDEHHPAAVIAFQEVPRAETYRYGIAKFKPGTHPPEVLSIVEKPTPEQAPSTLAQIGRFILTPKILDVLEANLHTLNPSEELYLTGAIDTLCRTERVLAHKIDGQWLTTGDPLRYLMANVEYALRDAEIGEAFANYLRSLDLPIKH